MSKGTSPFSGHGAEFEALSHLSVSVFRLNGLLLELGDELVAPLGLTSARWQMLGALAFVSTRLTAPQVGRAMGVSRQGAQKQLNALHELGLVETAPNPAHKRSPFYQLTADGRQLYDQAEKLWARRIATIANEIPPAQAEAAIATLEILQRLLSPGPRADEEPGR